MNRSDRPTADLLRDASERAIRFLATLDQRAVAPTREAVGALDRLREPLPAASGNAHDTLRILDELGSPATLGIAGRRFFGFVMGGSLPVTVAASWLATAWDQNSAFFETAPAASRVEEVALGWLLELLGLPADSAGAFVTGATVANLTALAAARGAVLRRAGWDVEANGLFGAPEVTVVAGEEAHPTLLKSLGLLGFGRKKPLRVPVDGQGRLRPERLPRLRGPSIVCTQAGNVNTGAFDAVAEICDRAHADGAWVHVDGAFGLWAQAAPARRHLSAGIEMADSWATDAHKYLNVPYDSGLAFVRDRDALRSAMAVTADYLPKSNGHRDPSDYTPELSRRARGVEIWAALRQLGRAGVADLVERTCRFARRFADALAADGYEILNEVELNQVLVSFGDPETTRGVIADLQRDGTCWCGGTVWQGRTAMRISVSSWATTEEDVERSLEAMLRVAAKHRHPVDAGAARP